MRALLLALIVVMAAPPARAADAPASRDNAGAVTDTTARVPSRDAPYLGICKDASHLGVSPEGEGRGFTAPDKLEHASLSLTAGLLIGIATREPGAAFGGSLALGLGKELWDRKRTFFDPRDLAADLLGAAAAAWITHALTR